METRATDEAPTSKDSVFRTGKGVGTIITLPTQLIETKENSGPPVLCIHHKTSKSQAHVGSLQQIAVPLADKFRDAL